MNFQSHVSRSGGLRLSLADVITRLEQSPDLKRQRRYEITSAIRVACKALGLPTAAVAADPNELLPRLEALPLALTGCGARCARSG